MPSLKELEKWLTTSETASRLGKTRQGIVWLCENGRLRAVKTSLGWLIDPKAVEHYTRKEH
jgi:excisionase family DNA binding protein